MCRMWGKNVFRVFQFERFLISSKILRLPIFIFMSVCVCEWLYMFWEYFVHMNWNDSYSEGVKLFFSFSPSSCTSKDRASSVVCFIWFPTNILHITPTFFVSYFKSCVHWLSSYTSVPTTKFHQHHQWCDLKQTQISLFLKRFRFVIFLFTYI